MGICLLLLNPTNRFSVQRARSILLHVIFCQRNAPDPRLTYIGETIWNALGLDGTAANSLSVEGRKKRTGFICCLLPIPLFPDHLALRYWLGFEISCSVDQTNWLLIWPSFDWGWFVFSVSPVRFDDPDGANVEPVRSSREAWRTNDSIDLSTVNPVKFFFTYRWIQPICQTIRLSNTLLGLMNFLN